MARSLSMDLRRRVIQAVNEGASRREAAARFGVSAASAVRWCARLRDTGDASARRQGGDRVSHRIEAHAELILGLLEKERDPTLWRFFRRHGVTRKKRPRTPANRTVPTL
jgi:transposase